MALTSDQITAQNFADFYQKILPYLNGNYRKLDYANAETISAMPYTATKDGVAFLQVGNGSNEGGRTFSVNGTAIAAFSTANNQAGKGTITIPLSSGDTITSNAGVFGSYTFVPYR